MKDVEFPELSQSKPSTQQSTTTTTTTTTTVNYNLALSEPTPKKDKTASTENLKGWIYLTKLQQLATFQETPPVSILFPDNKQSSEQIFCDMVWNWERHAQEYIELYGLSIYLYDYGLYSYGNDADDSTYETNEYSPQD